MEGEGLPPSVQPLTIIVSPVKHSSMAMLSFTNPFSCGVHYSIHLDTEKDLFCLLVKHPRDVYLQSGVSLDLPVMFAPDNMELCSASLILTTTVKDGDLSWHYPIHGVPEMVVTPTSPHSKAPEAVVTPTLSHPNVPEVVVTPSSLYSKVIQVVGRAKERLEQRIEVVINLANESGCGLRHISSTGSSPSDSPLMEKYGYKLVSTGGNGGGLFDSSVGIHLVKEMCMDEMQEIVLMFDIVFYPSKPFK